MFPSPSLLHERNFDLGRIRGAKTLGFGLLSNRGLRVLVLRLHSFSLEGVLSSSLPFSQVSLPPAAIRNWTWRQKVYKKSLAVWTYVTSWGPSERQREGEVSWRGGERSCLVWDLSHDQKRSWTYLPRAFQIDGIIGIFKSPAHLSCILDCQDFFWETCCTGWSFNHTLEIAICRRQILIQGIFITFNCYQLPWLFSVVLQFYVTPVSDMTHFWKDL